MNLEKQRKNGQTNMQKYSAMKTHTRSALYADKNRRRISQKVIEPVNEGQEESHDE